MPNLSQIKRQRMLDFLETLKKEHTDDESIRAFTEIENQLRDKNMDLFGRNIQSEWMRCSKKTFPFSQKMLIRK